MNFLSDMRDSKSDLMKQKHEALLNQAGLLRGFVSWGTAASDLSVCRAADPSWVPPSMPASYTGDWWAILDD